MFKFLQFEEVIDVENYILTQSVVFTDVEAEVIVVVFGVFAEGHFKKDRLAPFLLLYLFAISIGKGFVGVAVGE